MKSDEILIKTFNQVKNDNFDQVKFDQVIVCRQDYYNYNNYRLNTQLIYKYILSRTFALSENLLN